MKQITREELKQLGGAPDAKFVIFYHTGDLYLCTAADHVIIDEGYWTEKGYSCGEVVDESAN